MRCLFSVMLMSVLLAAPAAHALAPLTDAQIQGFIAAMPEFRAIGRKYHATDLPVRPLSPEGAARRAQAPFTSALPAMRAHKAYDALQAMVHRHGFSDLSEFTGIADRIVNGFMAVRIGAQATEIERRMQAAIRQVEASQVSDEEKRRTIAAIRSAEQVAASYRDVPEADQAAVRPHMDEIAAALQ